MNEVKKKIAEKLKSTEPFSSMLACGDSLGGHMSAYQLIKLIEEGNRCNILEDVWRECYKEVNFIYSEKGETYVTEITWKIINDICKGIKLMPINNSLLVEDTIDNYIF